MAKYSVISDVSRTIVDLLRGELYQDGRMVIRCELTDFERETETG